MVTEERKEKYRELVRMLHKEGMPVQKAVEAVQKFARWNVENPDIWQRFEDLALNLIANGIERYGARGIFEKLRFDHSIQRRSEFKCNNNFPQYMGRLFILYYPQHADFFERRAIKGAEA